MIYIYIFKAIIGSPIQKVWSIVNKLDFLWWKLVKDSTLVNGSKSFHELDGNIKLNFKDGKLNCILEKKMLFSDKK